MVTPYIGAFSNLFLFVQISVPFHCTTGELTFFIENFPSLHLPSLNSPPPHPPPLLKISRGNADNALLQRTTMNAKFRANITYNRRYVMMDVSMVCTQREATAASHHDTRISCYTHFRSHIHNWTALIHSHHYHPCNTEIIVEIRWQVMCFASKPALALIVKNNRICCLMCFPNKWLIAESPQRMSLWNHQYKQVKKRDKEVGRTWAFTPPLPEQPISLITN